MSNFITDPVKYLYPNAGSFPRPSYKSLVAQFGEDLAAKLRDALNGTTSISKAMHRCKDALPDGQAVKWHYNWLYVDVADTYGATIAYNSRGRGRFVLLPNGIGSVAK